MTRSILLAASLALPAAALAQSDVPGTPGLNSTDPAGPTPLGTSEFHGSATPGTTNCTRASDPDCRTGPAGGSMGSGGGSLPGGIDSNLDTMPPDIIHGGSDGAGIGVIPRRDAPAGNPGAAP